MQQTNSKTFTYQTRLILEVDQDAILCSYSEQMTRMERRLFADLAANNLVNTLKKEYIASFGITARQFNSCRIQVEGKINSIKERSIGIINELKEQISILEARIQKLEKNALHSAKTHQKKRRLFHLKSKLSRLESDRAAGKTKLCFGSKKLFNAQFHLESNGFASHEEWLSQWRQARSNSFFLVGSKDEAGGNQSCTATIQEDGSLRLRLRLPDILVKDRNKYLTIDNIHFKYGHAIILANLKSCLERNRLCKQGDSSYKEYGEAITYRLKRDKKGWILFASTSYSEPAKKTFKEFGTIGVDINANHLAITETDRFGSPIKHRAISLTCYGKDTRQSKSLIAEAAVAVVNWALASQKPIIMEKLDFQKKKTALKETASSKQARMLSSFAYNAIINSMKSRAWRYGVKVEEVNPAFTSVIGRVKFAKRYGLSIHGSAALCIARRSIGASERLPRYQENVPDGKGGHVTFTLPVRNREKHVWQQWRQILRKLQVVLVAHFRTRKRSSGRLVPACCDR
jgi:IS605 OrfB family transposase